MGLYKQTTCIFTDLDAVPHFDDRDAIEYFVTINQRRHFIRIPFHTTQWLTEDDFYKKHKNIFWGLLYNDDWFEDESIIYNY